MSAILYSRGRDKFDNIPDQREAANFGEFQKAILIDRSQKKGKIYICAAMIEGFNDDQKKYPGKKTWRAKHLSASRVFLPFDFDGFDVSETFARVLVWFKPYRGFAYTTASHTADKPRCRVILALTRATTREEGVSLGEAVQRMIERDIGEGKIKFDDSVYRAEQPLFTPLKDSQTFQFDGCPVEVDTILNDWSLRHESENEKKPHDGNEENSFLEGGRNNSLASVAGSLRRLGAPVAAIESILQSTNENLCIPPLPRNEVENISKSIGRYQPDPPCSSPVRADFRLIPVVDLLREPKPHDWIIRGYLEADSLNLLFGDPTVGKSLLAVDWAACVAVGREWGECSTKRGSVIYLAGEGHNGLSRRLKGWEIAQRCTLDDAPIFVSTEAISLVDLTSAHKIIKAAETIIERHGIPALLIVDTLARHFAGGDENGAPDMTQFIAALDALRQRYHCAVLVVHHSGHGNKGRARAHSVLPAAVDSIFCLTSDKNNVRVLQCNKAKDFEAPKDRAFFVRGVSLPWFDDDQLTYLTAPVLEAAASLPTIKDRSPPPSVQKALCALCEAIEMAGIKAPARCIAEAGNELAIQSGKVSTIEDWKKRYFQTSGNASKEAVRRSFGRAKNMLLEQGRIRVFDSWVWLPKFMADLSATTASDI